MSTVSVIIPTYNSAHYVTAAVESVLAQTFTDTEILVIDDGSTDDTRAVMSRYGDRVRTIFQENAGVSVARNTGIAESQGHYVAFLDADDTWMPHKLETQIAHLQATPEAEFCYAGFIEVDDELRPLRVRHGKQSTNALEDLLFYGNIVGSVCTVLIARDLVERIGGFDPQFSQCADWDFYVRVARQTKFLYVDEPLVTYRQHGTNMMKNTPLLESDSLQVLHKGFSHPATPSHLRRRSKRAFGHNWMVIAGCYFQARRYSDFARCVFQSLRYDPSQINYLLRFPLRRLRHARRSN